MQGTCRYFDIEASRLKGQRLDGCVAQQSQEEEVAPGFLATWLPIIPRQTSILSSAANCSSFIFHSPITLLMQLYPRFLVALF